MKARAFGLALSVGLAAALPASAAAPRLLLRADFDQGSAAPVLGHGERTSCLARALDADPGFGGAGGALRVRDGEECAFPAAGHLNPKAGTLSFWARPYDWSGGAGRYQVLFEWGGEANGEPFGFYVDSPGESDTVRLVMNFGAWRDPHQKLFQINARAVWRTELWQKIDVSWDEQEIVIYANGVAGERLPLETVELPAAEGGRLRVTPGPGLGQQGKATWIDELEIWDAALPADRIAKRFRAAQAKPLAAVDLTAPRVEAAPSVDGRLDDAAWRRATRVPLLADAETGFAGLLVPHAAFVWSADALHVALEAPLTDPADIFELTLSQPPGSAARTFLVTPNGLAGDDAVSAARARAAAQAGDDAWTAELSLPLAELGGAARAGTSLGVALRHRPADAGALGVGARVAGSLMLADLDEGVRITGGPALALGQVALDFERGAGAEAEVSVSRDGRRVWRERASVHGRQALRAEREVGDGVLRIDVRDEEGRELAQLESRVLPLDTPGLLPVPEPDLRRLAVEVDLGWLDGRWRRALAAGRAAARLSDRGPEGVEGPLALELREGRARTSLASGLAPGQHAIRLELESPRESLSLGREVDVPELPWLGTKVGESEGVLDPWLPLGWDGDASVRVWGRHYAFAGPLLASVEGRGGAMLRAPMQLTLTTAAGTSALRTTSAEVTARSSARADFAGTAAFDGAPLDVSWSSSIEYDGFVLASLTLRPQTSGVRVDSLTLEIPLEPRFAKYLRGTQQGAAIWRGRVPWNGRRFQSSFEPFLWLSDEEEGFLWLSESAANWVGAERRGAVEVRGGADAGMTLRLIGESALLPGPVTYTFGFQATPVKPMLRDARAWNFGMAGEPTPHERSIAYFVAFAKADGLWELQRPLVVEASDEALRRRGVRPLYYGAASATPDFLPTYRLFAPLWRSGWTYSYAAQAEPANASRDAIPAHRVTGVCPADASWQDRMLYDADRLLRTTGALGVYTDTDEVFVDDESRHGCGYRDAFGRRGASWGILAKRRFAKRLATLLRSAGGERRYWMSHAHTRLVPPVTGFADFWYPGEELTGQLGRSPWFYSDGLEEVAWRVEYRGESSGIVHVLLPELERGSGSRAHVEEKGYTESLLAMTAVNDVNVSSAWTNTDSTGEYWELRERLGLVPAEFVGHWRSDCPVRALAPDARASLYRAARGPVLVVASRSALARSVDVQLDLASLGLAGEVEARDERSGKRLELRGDRLAVPLAARSYTYVTLRGSATPPEEEGS